MQRGIASLPVMPVKRIVWSDRTLLTACILSRHDSGQQGHQYAVGRTTNIPGLFFSNPVIESGRFIGAVVVKREVRKFSNWTKPANVYITDANGVIVMAPEKQSEFRYMPNAPAANMSAGQIHCSINGMNLSLCRSLTGGIPSLHVVLIGGELYRQYSGSKSLAESAITIYVHSPLNELERFSAENIGFFCCSLLLEKC